MKMRISYQEIIQRKHMGKENIYRHHYYSFNEFDFSGNIARSTIQSSLNSTSSKESMHPESENENTNKNPEIRAYAPRSMIHSDIVCLTEENNFVPRDHPKEEEFMLTKSAGRPRLARQSPNESLDDFESIDKSGIYDNSNGKSMNFYFRKITHKGKIIFRSS